MMIRKWKAACWLFLLFLTMPIISNNLRKGDRSNITALALTPAGTLAAVGLNGEIKEWNLECGNVVQEFADIAGICFSHDGRLMGTSKDDTIQIWEMESGQLLSSLTDQGGKLWARTKTTAFSPDGRFFASTGTDGTIRIWETVSGEVVQRLKGHTTGIAAIAYSPDGRFAQKPLNIKFCGFDKNYKRYLCSLRRRSEGIFLPPEDNCCAN